MDNLTIVPATLMDAEEIYALYHRLMDMTYSTWDEEYPSREIVEHDLENNHVLVMKNDAGKIVAAIAMTTDNEEFDSISTWYDDVTRWMTLSRLGVDQSMQGKGIAKQMLTAAMQECKKYGAQAVRFLVSKTNPIAQRAYAKLNFDICGEMICYDMPWLCYQKRL